jgi:Zn-dependent peptidase ImmA (M78 family)
MSAADRNRKLAQDILRQYWDRKVPVDPAVLAQKMGAKVVGSDMGEVSGCFTLKEDGPLIQYNSTEAEVRQRFSIAHELAHYALGHGDAFRDTARDFSAAHFDHKEVSANRFASEILMPEAAVMQFIRDEGVNEIGKLARRFNVSEAAMKFRLKRLGWIS